MDIEQIRFHLQIISRTFFLYFYYEAMCVEVGLHKFCRLTMQQCPFLFKIIAGAPYKITSKEVRLW